MHKTLWGLPSALRLKAKGVTVADRAPCLLWPFVTLRLHLLLSPRTLAKCFPNVSGSLCIWGAFSCSSLCSVLTPKSFMSKVHMSEFAQDTPGLNSLSCIIINCVPFHSQRCPGWDDKWYGILPTACSIPSFRSYPNCHSLPWHSPSIFPAYYFSRIPPVILDL